MHPFALNQQETTEVTGGTDEVSPADGKALSEKLIGVKPVFPPVYSTMALGEEGGEYPPVLKR